MKKIVIINSTLRKGGNSERLADEFKRGAIESGNEVEVISLAGKQLAFCKGCMACQKIGKCVINDDANSIAEIVRESNVVVFASPVYYYSIAGQLKTLIDRMNSLYSSDYKFTDVYLLATAAEDENYTPEGAEKAIQGWVDCFERATLKQVIFAGGVNDVGDIDGHSALKIAYEAGRNA